MVRLGYACINTVLRAKKIYTNRTARLATLREKGIDFIKEIGRTNIKDLVPIIQWNEENGIRFMRVSSTVFPFASEPTHGYSLDYAAKELKEAGDLAKKYGHRLTTHPGQYNVLCSPNPSVVFNTYRDLAYHCQMLDLMGLGSDSVMIIHMGGTYGNKPEALERFEKNFLGMPENVRNRIVLENDEVSYNVEELLPTCKKLKIPLVLDWHHDRLNPSTKPIAEYLPEIEAIWKERGIKMKQHYSESAIGHPNPRTHSDYISKLPPCAPDMDLMIEAKMKEQTVLRICRKYGIVPDTKTYPEGEPKSLPDDEEVEKQVVMLGRARKRHDWVKGDDDGEKKPRKKRASKKKASTSDEEEEETKPKKRQRKTTTKKSAKSSSSASDEAEDEDGDEKAEPKPKRQRKSPAKKAAKSEEGEDGEDKPKPKRQRRSTKSEAAVSDESTSSSTTPISARRRKTPTKKEENSEDSSDISEEAAPKPKRQRRSSTTKTSVAAELTNVDSQDSTTTTPKKRTTRSRKATSDDDDDSSVEAPKKRTRTSTRRTTKQAASEQSTPAASTTPATSTTPAISTIPATSTTSTTSSDNSSEQSLASSSEISSLSSESSFSSLSSDESLNSSVEITKDVAESNAEHHHEKEGKCSCEEDVVVEINDWGELQKENVEKQKEASKLIQQAHDSARQSM